MRTLLFVSISSSILVAWAAADTQPHSHLTDEQSISRIGDDFSAAWNRHDMKTLSELCTEDADFVVTTGRHLRGREEIFAYHDVLHESIFKDRTLSAKLKDLRFMRADVAIGHLNFEGGATSGDERRRTAAFATIVVVKEQGNWLISAFHNTLLSGQPGGVLPEDRTNEE